MKTLFRWAFRLCLLMVVVLVACILLLDNIVKAIAENRIRSRTGMEVKIGSLHIGLTSPVISIEDFRLYNPAEFGGSPLVDMPELHVEYDLNALLKHKIHCRLIRFDLAEVNVVQAKDGRTNIQFLQGRQPHPAAGPAGAPAHKPGYAFQPQEFGGIDVLNLTLGRVTFMNMNSPSQVQEVDLKIRHAVLPDIHDQQGFQMKIAATLLNHNGLALVQMFPSSLNVLFSSLSGAVGINEAK